MENELSLSSELGSGAMGTVWSGYDDVLQRRVAVKELKVPPGVPRAGGPRPARTHLREARALGGLSHPNVITVFDVVVDGGEPVVVLEMVPSRNLATMICEQGALTAGQAAVVGFATAAALRAAHRAGSPTATSSRATCSSPTTAASSSPTSASPATPPTPHDQRRPRARLARLHRARGGGGPARHARRRPVGARRHAVRRRRGPPALRRARRPRVDDHRGRRRRGAAAARLGPGRRRHRRADGQGPGPPHAARARCAGGCAR